MEKNTWEERFDNFAKELMLREETVSGFDERGFAKNFITTEIEMARIKTLRGVIASIRSAKVQPPRHADEEPFYEIKTKWLEELKGEVLAALQVSDLSDKED